MTNIYMIYNSKTRSVKIGRSENPLERLKQLQIANSHLLELLYVIPNKPETYEAHIHGICQRFHVSGEWFREDVLKSHLLKHPCFSSEMITAKEYSKLLEVSPVSSLGSHTIV